MKYLFLLINAVWLALVLTYGYTIDKLESQLKNEQHYRQLEIDYLKMQCNQLLRGCNE